MCPFCELVMCVGVCVCFMMAGDNFIQCVTSFKTSRRKFSAPYSNVNYRIDPSFGRSGVRGGDRRMRSFPHWSTFSLRLGCRTMRTRQRRRSCLLKPVTGTRPDDGHQNNTGSAQSPEDFRNHQTNQPTDTHTHTRTYDTAIFAACCFR